MTVLISSEKKAHIYEKRYNQQKTNSVSYNQRTQQNYAEDASSIIESTKCYHFLYLPSLSITFGAPYLGILAETTYAESDFCNYINTKIDCLLGRATDTGRLGKQIYQSLLGYSTATITRAITETLRIINTDIKYYVAQQFPQIQQPVKSDPEEYENESNNPITVQAKSMNCIQPIPRNSVRNTMNSWKSTPLESTQLNQITRRIRIAPPAQNLVESASLLIEETAILQPIGSSDKGKQPALAPEEHSNTWTPIPLNITSNTPPINRIMAYRDIAKLEKFFGEEDNAYSWITDAEKAITTNGWNDDYTIQALLFFLTRTTNSCLQDTIALAHNFESTEQEVNHIQAINLAINRTSNIDAKITQLSEKLTQKIEQPRYQQNMVPQYSIPQNQLPLYTQQVSYTQPPLQNYYQPPPMTQTIPHYQTSPYSPSRPRAIDYNQGWRNSNNNQMQTNSGPFRPIPCSPAQSRPTPTEYPNQASYLGLIED
ncbi:hypothetical protein G9A89_020922 [Geosiphon pyriformis]|nr:hypothetical protein G9A89_020922 [Geosiphon pyriformis]